MPGAPGPTPSLLRTGSHDTDFALAGVEELRQVFECSERGVGDRAPGEYDFFRRYCNRNASLGNGGLLKSGCQGGRRTRRRGRLPTGRTGENDTHKDSKLQERHGENDGS